MSGHMVQQDVPAFEPIAVIAAACLLPGCSSPEQLWADVLAGRDWVGEGLTRLDDGEVDLAGLAIGPAGVPAHDPAFGWALQGGREAVARAGLLPGAAARVGRVGACVLGSMFLPTRELVKLCGRAWVGTGEADARSLDSAGGPVALLARALRLEGEAIAVDAACASSLYALKLGSDMLHDGRADWVLVGGVSHADDQVLGLALGTVGVLSPSGQSRPFHQEADGMVRSEGAAFVVLKRLADVGDEPVLGVLRGIGVGNSGQTRALLAPSERGQVAVIREALAGAGLEPADVSLLECHATGGPLSDLIELRALKRVFPAPLTIGSLRSNLGHPIAASGLASLIKVMAAMRAGVRPPGLHADDPVREVARTGCRLVTAAEPWESAGPRRAGISGFGFGGSNAHVVVEEPGGCSALGSGVQPLAPVPLVIVGVGVQVGAAHGVEALRGGVGWDVPFVHGHFDDPELEEALPQQQALWGVAQSAMAGVPRGPDAVGGTAIALTCDPNGARCAFPGLPGGAATAAAFTGRLTNLATNRLNFTLDLRGPGWTLAGAESGGWVAVEVARRALWAGELDLALVGAVDLRADPLDGERGVDAAVALVLMREVDAVALGATILGRLPDVPGPALPARFGGAAEALLGVVAGLATPGLPGYQQV